MHVVDIVTERGDKPLSPPTETFPTFYHREREAMVALAYASSGSRLAAEDIAQEAFAAAYRDWARISRLDNPATWVRRVVINRSVSDIRTRAASIRALTRLRGMTHRAVLPPVSGEAEHVWREVRRLPRRQRQVVALHYVDQLTLVEIADVLACSRESVNTHLRRAKENLARRLDTEELS